jgi:hypothetical protein
MFLGFIFFKVKLASYWMFNLLVKLEVLDQVISKS